MFGKTLVAVAVVVLFATNVRGTGVSTAETAGHVAIGGGLSRIVELSPHVEVLVDPAADMSIDDVMANGAGFETNLRRIPSFGFTRAAVWLRFRILSESDQVEDVITVLGTARLSHLTWYLVADGRVLESFSCGAADLPRRKERLPVFQWRLPPGAEMTIYLRAESDTSIWLPIRLGLADVMRQAELRQATADALETGFCLAITFLSLLLGWVRRARMYLHLALVSAGYCLYFIIFNGYVTHMWPEAPQWVERQGLGLSVGVGLFAFGLLNRRFSGRSAPPGRMARGVERATRCLPVVIMGSFLLLDFHVAVRWLHPLGLAGVLCSLTVVLGSGRTRREDRWFAAAWAVLGFALVMFGLQFGNIVPFLVPIRILQLLTVPSILTAFFLAVLMRQRVSDAEEEQRRSERQAYDLVGSIAAGTFEVALMPDARGVVQPGFRFVNSRFLDMFGLTHEALIADPALVSVRIHPDDAPVLAAAHTEAFATKGPFRWEGRIDIPGETRWYLIACTPRIDHYGETLWTGLVSDVTDRVKAERELAETLENEKRLRAGAEVLRREAEKAHEAKSMFLAKMSHEIRTPLSALVSLSQAMWMRGERQEAAADFTGFLNRVRSGGQYLNLLLCNVLNVSAAESGRVPVSAVDFYVADWIEEIRNILGPIADYHCGTIAWIHPNDDEARWRTDQMRLTQIVLNLGQNALKFSVGCDEPVRIEVRIADGLLRLVVEDCGPGIPAEQVDQVFAEYAQAGTGDSHVEQGVGLGLAVVKINAGLLGGTVRVQPREHRGTRFVVEIPRMEKAHLTQALSSTT